MTDLLTRLEAAKEGSRELDKLMWEFVSDIPYHEWTPLPPPPRPAFTTSLDAITRLIERELPGWSWGVFRGLGHFKGYVRNDMHLMPQHAIEGAHSSISALALCIAFVKAKEAKDG